MEKTKPLSGIRVLGLGAFVAGPYAATILGSLGLLSAYDVLIENSRPGVMDPLGLGADVVRAINPAMIYSSVSGFGDGGPWKHRAAFDTIGLSASGFNSIMSDEGKPRLAGTCVGDLATALVSVIGIVAGLRERLAAVEKGSPGDGVKQQNASSLRRPQRDHDT